MSDIPGDDVPMPPDDWYETHKTDYELLGDGSEEEADD